MIFTTWERDPTEDEETYVSAGTGYGTGLEAAVTHRLSVDFEGTPNEVRYEFWSWHVGRTVTVTDEQGDYGAYEGIGSGSIDTNVPNAAGQAQAKAFCEAVAQVWAEQAVKAQNLEYVLGRLGPVAKRDEREVLEAELQKLSAKGLATLEYVLASYFAHIKGGGT